MYPKEHLNTSVTWFISEKLIHHEEGSDSSQPDTLQPSFFSQYLINNRTATICCERIHHWELQTGISGQKGLISSSLPLHSPDNVLGMLQYVSNGNYSQIIGLPFTSVHKDKSLHCNAARRNQVSRCKNAGREAAYVILSSAAGRYLPKKVSERSERQQWSGVGAERLHRNLYALIDPPQSLSLNRRGGGFRWKVPAPSSSTDWLRTSLLSVMEMHYSNDPAFLLILLSIWVDWSIVRWWTGNNCQPSPSSQFRNCSY